MTPTLETVLQEVQALPLEDQRLLAELIEPPRPLDQLAAEQGVKPFDFAVALKAANFWPVDESLEELLAMLREWRQEGAERMID